MATTPKDVPEHDVFAVYARIARTLAAEGFTGLMGPGNPEDQVFYDVDGLSPRAAALYGMLKRVYLVRSRILADRNTEAFDQKFPERAGLHDEALTLRAYQDLELARKLVRKAEAAFGERWEVVQRGMHPLKVEPVAERLAQSCGVIGELLERVIACNVSVDRRPVITTARDWEELLTDLVEVMLDNGLFSDEECAEVIVGSRSQHRAMRLRWERRQSESQGSPRGARPDQ